MDPLIHFSLFFTFFACLLLFKRGTRHALRLSLERTTDSIFGAPFSVNWDWLKYYLYLGPSFVMPDIISYCKYPVVLNPHCEEQSQAGLEWIIELGDLDEERCHYFREVGKPATLVGLTYPFADPERLRVSIDWMFYINLLDDKLDHLNSEDISRIKESCIAAMRDPFSFQTNDTAAILTKSWCSRLEKLSGPACKERMIHTMIDWFQGVAEQASYRALNQVPGIDEFMALRKLTVGVMPVLVLTEFCGGYHLPDHVYDHPVIKSLQHAVLEHVAYTNDIVSYNVEQARGDTHNLITITMKHRGLSLQEAVDSVGARCNSCIDKFESARRLVPSWGAKIDEMVAKYITGLEFWISGNLYWCFLTRRYLGKKGMDYWTFKRRVIRLYPKKTKTK